MGSPVPIEAAVIQEVSHDCHGLFQTGHRTPPWIDHPLVSPAIPDLVAVTRETWADLYRNP